MWRCNSRTTIICSVIGIVCGTIAFPKMDVAYISSFMTYHRDCNTNVLDTDSTYKVFDKVKLFLFLLFGRIIPKIMSGTIAFPKMDVAYISSFMTYHRDCNWSNTTGATSESGTAYTSGAPEFTPVFSGVLVTRSLVFICMFS
jgi:hypothetical protein